MSEQSNPTSASADGLSRAPPPDGVPLLRMSSRTDAQEGPSAGTAPGTSTAAPVGPLRNQRRTTPRGVYGGPERSALEMWEQEVFGKINDDAATRQHAKVKKSEDRAGGQGGRKAGKNSDYVDHLGDQLGPGKHWRDGNEEQFEGGGQQQQHVGQQTVVLAGVGGGGAVMGYHVAGQPGQAINVGQQVVAVPMAVPMGQPGVVGPSGATVVPVYTGGGQVPPMVYTAGGNPYVVPGQQDVDYTLRPTPGYYNRRALDGPTVAGAGWPGMEQPHSWSAGAGWPGMEQPVYQISSGGAAAPHSAGSLGYGSSGGYVGPPIPYGGGSAPTTTPGYYGGSPGMGPHPASGKPGSILLGMKNGGKGAQQHSSGERGNKHGKKGGVGPQQKGTTGAGQTNTDGDVGTTPRRRQRKKKDKGPTGANAAGLGTTPSPAAGTTVSARIVSGGAPGTSATGLSPTELASHVGASPTELAQSGIVFEKIPRRQQIQQRRQQNNPTTTASNIRSVNDRRFNPPVSSQDPAQRLDDPLYNSLDDPANDPDIGRTIHVSPGGDDPPLLSHASQTTGSFYSYEKTTNTTDSGDKPKDGGAGVPTGWDGGNTRDMNLDATWPAAGAGANHGASLGGGGTTIATVNSDQFESPKLKPISVYGEFSSAPGGERRGGGSSSSRRSGLKSGEQSGGTSGGTSGEQSIRSVGGTELRPDARKVGKVAMGQFGIPGGLSSDGQRQGGGGPPAVMTFNVVSRADGNKQRGVPVRASAAEGVGVGVSAAEQGGGMVSGGKVASAAEGGGIVSSGGKAAEGGGMVSSGGKGAGGNSIVISGGKMADGGSGKAAASASSGASVPSGASEEEEEASPATASAPAGPVKSSAPTSEIAEQQRRSAEQRRGEREDVAPRRLPDTSVEENDGVVLRAHAGVREPGPSPVPLAFAPYPIPRADSGSDRDSSGRDSNRPATTNVVARRMILGHLGKTREMTDEQKKQEKEFWAKAPEEKNSAEEEKKSSLAKSPPLAEKTSSPPLAFNSGAVESGSDSSGQTSDRPIAGARRAGRPIAESSISGSAAVPPIAGTVSGSDSTSDRGDHGRPRTTNVVARRMILGHLGRTRDMTDEQKKQEREFWGKDGK